MNFSVSDRNYMARAIKLARRGWFTTRRNPRVGCVLVKDNQIIGEGWHQKPGLEHAEINALAKAREDAKDTKGATAYVTLEPCAHHGKTAPCAEALIKAGVKKVICAMLDPNPLVSGKGLQILTVAGVETEIGLLETESQNLNLGFSKRMTQGLPRVVVKSAISLDGRTAMASGESQWITGDAARKDVQRLRAEAGAIITGSGTVIVDDPSLNVRATEIIADEHFCQPLRVIIDSQQLVDSNAKIFQQAGDAWLVVRDWSSKEYPANVNQEIIATNDSGKIDLTALLRKLAEQGINDVLVEAGSGLAAAFFEQELADELVVYMAPKVLGSDARAMFNLPFTKMDQAVGLELIDIRQIGDDIKLRYQLLN